MMTTPDEPRDWYAVRVRARYEASVAGALTEKGYGVLLPQYKCRRRWSDRMKEVTLPLFPGYLFCHLDVRHRLPLLVTPGVLHMVSAGQTLLPIAPEEIAAIQTLVASSLPLQPWPYLHVGGRVRIELGPLRGVEGILIGVNQQQHLVVSVTLLQRSVAVQIDPAHAVPAGAPHVLGYHAWQPPALDGASA
jgi:transcription antitermination factor NusG